jgi:NitT/TauT family transport system substrate-binding protein/putative hydroxymethylpyrimidine transport system substrate-binding protein
MRWVAAPLAAALLSMSIVACGGGGAEPGAPRGATLVLDFQPNAVHSGIYAAKANGYFRDEGLDLNIQEPSSSADSAKLLEAGRADFAVMDINDFGIARERGLDLVATAAIVQRPLAAVIARNRNEIRTPADLAGKTVGVTGVPSDDAVLDTVLASAGLAPDSVRRVTIGFNAVADLAAGKIDAATAFWNAEGVQLQQTGFPIREFRVDEFGAPRYPELLLVTSASVFKGDPGTKRERQLHNAGMQPRCGMTIGLERGYRTVLAKDPEVALNDLLEEVPGLDMPSQEDQLNALVETDAFTRPAGSPSEAAGVTSRLDPIAIAGWVDWAAGNGLIHPDRVRGSFKQLADDFCE